MVLGIGGSFPCSGSFGSFVRGVCGGQVGTDPVVVLRRTCALMTA